MFAIPTSDRLFEETLAYFPHYILRPKLRPSDLLSIFLPLFIAYVLLVFCEELWLVFSLSLPHFGGYNLCLTSLIAFRSSKVSKSNF